MRSRFVGIDIIIGILSEKATGKITRYADELKQVDKVSLH